MKLFISSEIGSEKWPSYTQSGSNTYGKSNYSWKIIASMYQQAFSDIGISTINISAPEIYQTKEAFRIKNINSCDIHIAIKPIEHIRPLFGIRNFFVCGWEFPEFGQSEIDGNPAYNSIATMGRADRIFCWSSFTAMNLVSYGVKCAIALPPPVFHLTNFEAELVDDLDTLHYDDNSVSSFSYSAFGTVCERYHSKFMMVLNPFDQRKNFGSLIRAFTKYAKSAEYLGSALIIKLIIDNMLTTKENIIDILKIHYGIFDFSEHIYFVGAHLRNSQMIGLYKSIDYYICASSAEGLNLPLIEAMGVGVVPISSRETAMQDYIQLDNAVVLPATRTKAVPAYDGAQFSSFGNALPLTHFPPSEDALEAGFAAAARMTPKIRASKSKRAIETVAERYGIARFKKDFWLTMGTK